MARRKAASELTIPAAAEAVGVPQQTLRDAVRLGDVSSRLVAGRWQVVERADVEAWAAARPRKRGRPAGK